MGPLYLRALHYEIFRIYSCGLFINGMFKRGKDILTKAKSHLCVRECVHVSVVVGGEVAKCGFCFTSCNYIISFLLH